MIYKLTGFVLTFILCQGLFAETNRKPNSVRRGFACSGTEPFYSLDIAGGKAVLKEAADEENQTKTYDVQGPIDAHGTASNNSFAFRSNDGKVVISIMSSRFVGAKCTDGMSDKEYRYHMMYVSDSGVLTGCCSIKNK